MVRRICLSDEEMKQKEEEEEETNLSVRGVKASLHTFSSISSSLDCSLSILSAMAFCTYTKLIINIYLAHEKRGEEGNTYSLEIAVDVVRTDGCVSDEIE